MNDAPFNKHLTLSDRIVIEQELFNDKTAKDIASLIGKDPSTISKEVKLHRITKQPNASINYSVDLLNLPLCQRQIRFPHVCNGCDPMKRKGCRKLRHYYRAENAHNEYLYDLSDSRAGYDISVSELSKLDSLISPLILNGQSLYHIKASNPELITQSERTLYRYTNDELFTCRSIDLPRKVRYSPRKKHRKKAAIKPDKIGHTYDDYLVFLADNDCPEVVQMDTVEGLITDSKCLLTIIFTHSKLMLIRLLPKQQAKYVTKCFKVLEKQLKSVETFKLLFNVILTDNGSEFNSIDDLETSPITGEKRMNLFFCEAMRSDQKVSLKKITSIYVL